jgi:hypothetical protein
MRLVAIAMIRNEADILPDFLGHCAALFDEVLVVDHASTDGTVQMLAAAARRMPLRVWRFAHQAKAQALVMTALARDAVARGADWVFPLDADEFPAMASRAALEARLAGAPPVVAWRWRNLWPGARGAFDAFPLAGRHESVARPVPKVVVHRSRVLADPGFAFGHGSHTLLPHDPAAPEAGMAIGELHHLPIRHPARFALKVAMNRTANPQRPHWRPGVGAQYERAEERRAEWMAPGGAALLRRFALWYPGLPARERRDAIETIDVVPLGRIEGLPAPVATPEEVMAREARLAWAPAPHPDPRRWRIELGAVEARLLARGD